MEQEKKKKPEREAKIDESIDESFPASDPPSYSAGKKDDPSKKDLREPPK